MEHIEHKLRHPDDEKQRIVNYWSKRSHDFSDQRLREQHGEIGKIWVEEITKHMPRGKESLILDVGCGTGFFCLLLSELGYETVGVDLTEHMILHAREMARLQNSNASFAIMDAENLELPSNVFDMVLTRNLTWTLPHPEKAYAEWHRVLRKGGVLLNFDADYGHDPANKDAELLPPEHAHHYVGRDMMKECDAIKAELYISEKHRPQWDMNLLRETGWKNVEVDEEIYKRIYFRVDEFYNPTPIFMLKAVK